MRNKTFKAGESVVLRIIQGSNASRYIRSETNIEKWIKDDNYAVKTVGRKYITIVNGNGWDIKFDKDDLMEVVKYGGSDYELFHTKEEIYEDIKSKKLFDTISSYFTAYGWNRHRKYTLSQLERIDAILNEGNDNELYNE